MGHSALHAGIAEANKLNRVISIELMGNMVLMPRIYRVTVEPEKMGSGLTAVT
jgi:hypothetical protein